MDFEKIRFDEKGLVPAVVQDYFTKEVLTVAYMNRESLEITVKEGYTCFYSRSRQELWRKGETSGNKQKVSQHCFRLRQRCAGNRGHKEWSGMSYGSRELFSQYGIC